MVLLRLQLLIAAGDDDGIVDVRAHLDGADDQVTEEEQVFSRDGREREVDPDTALNDQDQQQRHSRRVEREQQDKQHDQHRYDAHDRVIDREGLFKVVFVRGVARQIDVSIRIIAFRDVHDGVCKGVGLISADRQVQIEQHPAVLCALKLILCAEHLHLRIGEHLHLLVIERNDARVKLVADVQEHVDERHLIIGDISGKAPEFVMLHGVCRIDDLCQLIIKVCKLRELTRAELVCQAVAVHRLDVRHAHRAVDLVIALQLRKQFLLLVVVARRDDQREQIGLSEIVLDHLLGDLRFVELRRLKQTVDEGAVFGHAEADKKQRNEDDRHDMPRGIVDLSDKRDLRHKALVARLVDQRPEQHQKPRHHKER